MKQLINKICIHLSLVMLSLISYNAYGQVCKITYKGVPCVNSPITFYGLVTGTGHDWTIDGNKETIQDPSYTFPSAGLKNISYSVTDGLGNVCTSTLTLDIKENPTSVLTVTNLDKQCFKNNLFCFKDESIPGSSSTIRSLQYVVSDGQNFDFNGSPAMPKAFCLSLVDPAGGFFSIDHFVVDNNGCQTSKIYKDMIYVYPKIGANFTSNKPVKCDSAEAIVRNISLIPQTLVKTITWIWGDGSPNSSEWGPVVRHWYKKAGVFNAKMIIETLDGCKDSFTLGATATVFQGDPVIIAVDSLCHNVAVDKGVNFLPVGLPAGITGFLWNFGNPPDPNNINFRDLSPTYKGYSPGPWRITFTYGHPICGARTVDDTVIVLGPSSVIEKPFNRLAEYQVFQCPKYKLEPVQMKNFSVFYHNDTNLFNDNDVFQRVINKDTVRIHGFNPDQTAIDFVPANKRDMGKCVWRNWEFGDDYAPKCTTYTKGNQNVGVNCNYSSDSLPIHNYPSWDQIMLKDFKTQPMQDAIFIDSNRLCKRMLIYPDSFYYIIRDTFFTVPNDATDTNSAKAGSFKNIKTKHFLTEKGFRGKGTRYVESDVDVKIDAGDSLYIGDKDGNSKILYTGPNTIRAVKDRTLWLKSKTDSATFLLTLYVKTDTLPIPMLALRQANGEFPKVLSTIKQVRVGKKGFDYDINWKRWQDLYYARIPRCNNIKLVHQDTCLKFKCRSEITKQVTMLHANAGGVGSGMTQSSIPCLGQINPSYGITFILSDLKPGCTFSDVQINYNVNCDSNAWTPLSGLFPGGRPKSPIPYLGYQIMSNPPSRYTQVFNAALVQCSKNQCIDVGIIVGNGVSKSGTKPLCADTQYYDDFACFPIIDPAMEIIQPKVEPGKFMKICKNVPVYARPTLTNLTVIKDVENIRYIFNTGNAGPNFSRNYAYVIDEKYVHNYKIKNPINGKTYDSNILHNILIVKKGEQNPEQIPCSLAFKEGLFKWNKDEDTIVTAEIKVWDTIADVSRVFERIKERLDARGFDPFAISPVQMAKMIWNNVGTIGTPSSGAKGCIDTSGFGDDIVFKVVPSNNPANYKILHYRDTTIATLDSHIIRGKLTACYKFIPIWNGYYNLSLQINDKSGECVDQQSKSLIAGFGMFLGFEDSIVCSKQASSLIATPDYRMFHEDPVNFGTWDPVKYWNNPDRQNKSLLGDLNSERITRWDWSKEDDDVTKPNTIFGGDPYGGTGVGNPSKQLRSSIYYSKDSGVYTFRNIAGDSTGCMDTITRRIFVTKLDQKFGLTLNLKDCKSIVSFYDSSILHDPCRWARINCSNSKPVDCDFINSYWINWGDGSKTNFFPRAKITDLTINDREIAHTYRQRGWFTVTYILSTDQGCFDTLQKKLFIPGPRPKFTYQVFAGNEITICQGEKVEFDNQTDSFTNRSSWNWIYGDGFFKVTNSDSNVTHQYNKVGRFFVYMVARDSVTLLPFVKDICPVTYPDTPNQAGFYVNVIAKDSFETDITERTICVGESTTIFFKNTDSSFKSYVYKIFKPNSTVPDIITKTDSFHTDNYFERGQWTVILEPLYDPTRPKPWCLTDPDTITFDVDNINANFDIDSSGKPKFCFTNTTTPDGTNYKWGYKHSSDITLTGEPFDLIDEVTNKDKICYKYADTGNYWVCLISESAAGCKDTVCKLIINDYSQNINIANVFTPGNTDGLNDVFRVPITGQTQFEMRIFNRWNERVFQTEDAKVHWNGKVNNTGADVPDGTYFYILTYKFRGDKDPKVINGSVNVIRP